MSTNTNSDEFPDNLVRIALDPDLPEYHDPFFGLTDRYFGDCRLFMVVFKAIPQHIFMSDINCAKAIEWMKENLKEDIKKEYYAKRFVKKSQKMVYEDAYFFLYDDLIVNFSRTEFKVRLTFLKTDYEKVEKIMLELDKFNRRNKKPKPEISLLVQGYNSLETRSFDIVKPKLNIDDNYNDDFKEIHKIILKKLSTKNEKGIVLLHGKPGTGKTSYIRFLITCLKKRVIFLPPNMASEISNPNLISVLIDNPNSIFVIEDAENIIVDRDKEGASPVSGLLNIADGLLADCLNIQIICSFNTDLSKIDNALMRKGRLIAQYEFKELSVEKSQNLSNKLGFKTQISQPLTLANIYNQNDKEFNREESGKKIGF
ncbi:MAG: AAA family ATPase [Cytophagales bacterium]